MAAQLRAILQNDLSQESLADNEKAFVEWATVILGAVDTLVEVEGLERTLHTEAHTTVMELSNSRSAVAANPEAFSVEVRREYDTKIRDLATRTLTAKSLRDTEGAAA